MPHPALLVVTGASGTGKTTLVRGLEARALPGFRCHQFDSMNGTDVRIGGGAETVQQYLREVLIDELHLAISPVLLGRGERLFEGVDLQALGYGVSEFAASVVLQRRDRVEA